MEIAAAVGAGMWSDITDALLPNGRWLDSIKISSPETAQNPPGVLKGSWAQGLYLSGALVAKYATVENDPLVSLPNWLTEFDKGEPYEPHEIDPFFNEFENFSSAQYLPGAEDPPPTMVINGWNDDLVDAAC